ncbi:Uncharacterized protein FWK35_00027303 [Aphis craccivora]|uniref:Uncharacterized protein n=1 Tax=Aphis craccivora TaxID=307492 RepID=A0A6G0W084_APHCR|nr:Uncharacterized protein FWK35_00027303 [Aphis craccivora]
MCKLIVLDSERNDECIDFTMLCIFLFFVSVYTRTCRNNASISIFGGCFLYQNESSWCIGEFSKAPGKTKKKIKEKREFLSKTSFRPNRIFYMVTTEIFDFFEKFFFEVSIKKFWMTKKGINK